MTNTLWVYGDSFVAGDQDLEGKNNADPKVVDYNRYNVSFAAHLAKKLNRQLVNRAIPGCGNYPQLDQLILDLSSIKNNDYVIFCFTTLWRDRFILPIRYDIFASHRSPTMLHPALNQNDRDIPIIDFFYICSILKNIESIYGLKIIKLFAFHDPTQDTHSGWFKDFNFDYFIGLNQPGNTLLDVLTDNWGNKEYRISDHSKWTPPKEYRCFFTQKSHPNIDGHKKIADWLYGKIIEHRWIS